MADDFIDEPTGWTAVSPFETDNIRWHRYRYHPTENIGIEVQLGEALSSDESDTFRLHLSMRLADRGPVTHDFQVASYEDLNNARQATESLLSQLTDQESGSKYTHPLALIQDTITNLVPNEDSGIFGEFAARLYRLIFRH